MKNMKTKTAEKYLKEPYARVLTPDEDGRFVAEILEFEGCFTDGETETEALRKLDEVAKNWIELRLKKKQPIPEPIARYEMSGKFALRLPQSLHTKAAIMAEKEGVSLNTFIVSAIASRLGMIDLHQRLIEELNDSYQQRIKELDKRVAQLQAGGTREVYVQPQALLSSQTPIIQVLETAKTQ